MPERVGKRLDRIERQLEEMVDDNTTLVAELRRLEHTQREAAESAGHAVERLRHDLESRVVHTALRDLCLELIGPLAAMEAVAGGGLTDPAVAAGHLRSLALTLRGLLGRMGAEVVPIVVGQDRYDPERHHCVGVLTPAESPFPQAPPHTVVRIVEDGYLLGRRQLTPAQVEIQAR